MRSAEYVAEDVEKVKLTFCSVNIFKDFEGNMHHKSDVT